MQHHLHNNKNPSLFILFNNFDDTDLHNNDPALKRCLSSLTPLLLAWRPIMMIMMMMMILVMMMMLILAMRMVMMMMIMGVMTRSFPQRPLSPLTPLALL